MRVPGERISAITVVHEAHGGIFRSGHIRTNSGDTGLRIPDDIQNIRYALFAVLDGVDGDEGGPSGFLPAARPR